MTIAGINVIDADSLDAVADILDDVENWIACPECDGAKSIVDYSPDAGWIDGWIDVERPCCEGYGTILDADADDWDLEPPTPAAPAALTRRECSGAGTRRYSVGFGLSDWIEEACTWCAGTGSQPAHAPACPACAGTGKATHPAFAGAACWYCDGSGTDRLAGDVPPAAPVPFDRAAHCRRIGQTGGLTTVERHGVAHMRTIGAAGARVTIARHGTGYWRGLVAAKGWDGSRRPDLLSDLTAGRALADLDRAAWSVARGAIGSAAPRSALAERSIQMNATNGGTMARVGVGGTVNGYGVLVLGDVVVVERDGAEVARRRVEGVSRCVAAPRDLKLG